VRTPHTPLHSHDPRLQASLHWREHRTAGAVGFAAGCAAAWQRSEGNVKTTPQALGCVATPGQDVGCVGIDALVRHPCESGCVDDGADGAAPQPDKSPRDPQWRGPCHAAPGCGCRSALRSRTQIVHCCHGVAVGVGEFHAVGAPSPLHCEGGCGGALAVAALRRAPLPTVCPTRHAAQPKGAKETGSDSATQARETWRPTTCTDPTTILSRTRNCRGFPQVPSVVERVGQRLAGHKR